ncbi:MAG: HD domain-containing protein [Lachnospiraceae bacterium]|nr:HD domain-containing protein [Lachnospiraceae bacterium]
MKNLMINKNTFKSAACIACGVAVNVLLAFLMDVFKIPLYLDIIGTIGVALIGGALPGIFTAVVTNMLCSFFNGTAVYYSLLNVAIAIFVSRYIGKNLFRSIKTIIVIVTFSALVSGGAGAVVQWLLLGEPQFPAIADVVESITAGSGMSYFSTFIVFNILLNFVDKGISVLVAAFIVNMLPKDFKLSVLNSDLRQAVLSDEERMAFRHPKRRSTSLQTRVFVILIIMSVAIVIIMAYICLNLYASEYEKRSVENAWSTAYLASEFIDVDKIDSYVNEGRDAEGYIETERILQKVSLNSESVSYLYVVRILHDRVQFIFDIFNPSSADMKTHTFMPGETSEFEEAFLPYMDDLHAGFRVGPITSDTEDWDDVISVYYPVRNASGKTACYVCAEVSVPFMTSYIIAFVLRVIMVMSGFIALIIAYGFSKSNVFITYPITTITSATNRFVKDVADEDISVLNDDVRKLRKVNVRTGDEVQDLYNSLVSLTGNVTDQLWEIRHYAEAVEKMQNGLIITMADMVENRDSDTGAHIQKTAEYVRIIVNGLKRKGYYAEKLTSKYMSDVVMSAPLHDVGKINISDAILNKPGKLSDEEYEIMKTHTTLGRNLLEKAISTISGENYLKEARNMAAYHHEKWDGSGYPEGLHGEVIPLSARIMAVADVFDALSSKRVYKPAYPLNQALEIISNGAGKEFDPKCVEVFMDSLDEVKRVLRKYKEYEGEL